MVAPASRLNRGFTLIELLIAVAIVSILTAIGFVSYLSFIDKSRINSAQADLAALSLVSVSYTHLTLPTILLV